MPHAVTWFEISSNDPESLAAFYKKAFKWTTKSEFGMEFIPAQRDGDQQGINGGFAQAHGGAGGVTVYVTCSDIDAHLAKVEAAGGQALMPKVELPGGMGHIASFADPDGNRIGLWAPAKPAPAKKASEKKPSKKKVAKTKAPAKKVSKKKPSKKKPSKKKAPAKKAAKNKAPAKKASKKKPSKKTPSKKTPSKKTPSKKTPSRT